EDLRIRGQPFCEHDFLLSPSAQVHYLLFHARCLEVQFPGQIACHFLFSNRIQKQSVASKPFGSGKRDVESNASTKDKPFCLSIICNKRKSMANGVDRCVDGSRFTVEIDFSGLRLARAEQRFHKLGPSRPDQSCEADYLTATNTEADIVEFAASSQTLDAHGFFAIGWRLVIGELLADFPADHVPHEVVGCGFADRSGCNVPAIAKDGYAIGDL